MANELKWSYPRLIEKAAIDIPNDADADGVGELTELYRLSLVQEIGVLSGNLRPLVKVNQEMPELKVECDL